MSEVDSLEPAGELDTQLLRAPDMAHWHRVLDYISVHHEDIAYSDYLTADRIAEVLCVYGNLSAEDAGHVKAFVVPALALSGLIEPVQTYGPKGAIEVFDISDKGQRVLERTWEDNDFRQQVGLPVSESIAS